MVGSQEQIELVTYSRGHVNSLHVLYLLVAYR